MLGESAFEIEEKEEAGEKLLFWPGLSRVKGERRFLDPGAWSPFTSGYVVCRQDEARAFCNKIEWWSHVADNGIRGG